VKSGVESTGSAMRPSTAELGSDFECWVRPHVGAMRRVAAVTAPDLDPDDVVQEALLRAWRKSSTYQAERGPIRGWLIAITADRARRMRGRAKPRNIALLTDVDLTSSRREDSSLAMREAVLALPARQREAVLLFYYADLPVREVAAVMGCAEGTVKSTLSDARAHLQRTLGENGG